MALDPQDASVNNLLGRMHELSRPSAAGRYCLGTALHLSGMVLKPILTKLVDEKHHIISHCLVHFLLSLSSGPIGDYVDAAHPAPMLLSSPPYYVNHVLKMR